MEKNIRVLMSTMGPLHLIKSAEFLTGYVDIKVLQGWIPTKWNKWMLMPISRFVGRDIEKSFKKRTPERLNGKNYGLLLPEAYNNFARLVVKSQNLRNKMVGHSLRMFGFLSRFYIHDIDILHVRSGSGQGAISYAKAKGIKVVVDHSIAHPSFMDKQLRSEYKKFSIPFNLGMDSKLWQYVLEDCKKADIVLVNSQFVKDTFCEQGFSPDRISVVSLGVREDFHFLKQEYTLRDKKIRILFTGSFGFRKGAEYILRALCTLDEQNVDYEFTVVGSHQDALPLIERYTPKHIILVKPVPQEELKKYLTENDVYLFPSLCEGCASSGMEAMAVGLPVIATRESGLPIENGVNGLLVDSKNVSSIVSALKTVMENNDFRMMIGQNAAQTIHNCYTWEKYAEKVTKVYQRLIQS